MASGNISPREGAMSLFDLRHLRVIIYDIREPECATRFRKGISDCLRNSMKEPGKSIPYPFRKLLAEAENAPPLGRAIANELIGALPVAG